MATRIRTLNFLPEIFKTPTNSQFLNATLDQVVDQPNIKNIEGYVGSKVGYGVNAKDKYVIEPTKFRTDYQLDPGVAFLKKDTSTATDFISYPGIIDALKLEGGITNDNNRLFTSEFYSWDSFTDLDKIINYNQYYWLAEGPPAVTVTTETVFIATQYVVTDTVNGYYMIADGQAQGSTDPVLTLIRGGTYTFTVNQGSEFWIQGVPGVTGYDPTQPNVQTRDILGVENNGTNNGVVTFIVPTSDAQNEYILPGNNPVGVVSTLPFDSVNGQFANSLNIDGVTSLEGLTVMFYNTGVVNEEAFISSFYSEVPYDDITLPNNLGYYAGGYATDITSTIYTITYIGDPSNPIIKLVPGGTIPTGQNIIPQYGTEWIGRKFYKSITGTVDLVPYISANKDILYYQDGTSSNKVGKIQLISNNKTSRIDVVTDILGRKNYTSPNGVVFTNGLKIILSGNIYPTSYENNEYYVQGVGTAIELVAVTDLITPESFTFGKYLPYDTNPYDSNNYDSRLYIPLTQDYITIARNSIDRNPWSRSNRWFHIDVINATATYNKNPSITTIYATQDNKAKRPIIEFYPNLRLFNSGVVGKLPIDFIDYRTTDAFTLVAGQQNYYPDVEVYTQYTGVINSVSNGTSTTLTIARSSVVGVFQVGQFITDSANLLPNDTQITEIIGSTVLTITVAWPFTHTISTTTNVSFVANDLQNNQYALFDGARVVFAADTDINVRNKIYVSRFSVLADGNKPVITLTEAEDGTVLPDEQVAAYRGYNYQGIDFYFDGINWLEGQQKTTVNQPPLFDIFDKNGISFGDSTVYDASTFKGNKLFAYGLGTGIKDAVLGFPIRYSSVDNIGDISFDTSLNIDTFNYVVGYTPVTQKVNTGYVYNYSNLTTPVRQLGWQTAVGPTVQYQVFEFNYYANNPTNTFVCDIAKLSNSPWPSIQLFVNNRVQEITTYTFTTTDTTTIVTFDVPNPLVDTVIEIFLLSDQVSTTAYYSIPENLNNNPLNTDITQINLGDIRGQYESIFYNYPYFTGELFGSNNYRDLGNLVPYGNKLIQNSASLVLPGAFLRKQNHNLFNSLLYNSREYITYKTLLVDTVNNTDYGNRVIPSVLLDNAIEQITASKTDSNSFFWSDMLPSKAAYITNTYSFANALDISIYPLSRVYNFDTANYYGVLVYLTNSLGQTTQLIRNTDYVVSTDTPSLTITHDLQPNDTITINEYNQTYGSYVPNTPTKLGLYPATIPSVILDSAYSQPTYFILGHDGSYNKLYGTYVDGNLDDYRDQVLLEFETRIYNNLKLSNKIPIQAYEVLPGFFRNTQYSYEEFLEIYTPGFLNWVGQNRVNYKKQFYNSNNEYTYNYSNSGNKINNQPIEQGYWRGVYLYYYDTSNPDTMPWQMLGYTDMPTWWTSRYGPAPYTSENLVLWGDLAAGIDWNNGEPIVIPECIRPQLLEVLPVDSEGNLVSPFVSIVGNYNNQTLNHDWKVGDVSPTEFSYRRSSSWPFDLMRLMALTKPAEFFNLAVDIDNYKYSTEFSQYLVNDRSHLVLTDIPIYGSGTPATSYINWIVDYEKQVGIDATTNINNLLDNVDVRLVYRLAGFSDKNLLKFYVEKSTANSNNSSLLIPDESYQVLLYDNQPFDRIIYSGIVIQLTSEGYYRVYGNSQTNAYFTVLPPKINGKYDTIAVQQLKVQLAYDYYDTPVVIAYGTEFYSVQEVSQFLDSYGRYLASQGVLFDQIESGLEVSWRQMVAEFLYWAQSGWENGSIININPAAKFISINKDSYIVQPLTVQQQNFILNQTLYPIQNVDLSIVRDGTLFTAQPLNVGDTVAYGQFNISNFEHGIVFDNVTLFGDVIYNLTTGLRQNRIFVKGAKTAEWNGTIDAQGFILNQDNIQEWTKEIKYTKGQIVKYKNKYWTALKIIQAKELFEELEWKQTEYDQIQKGLLPNTSTRSYESTLYYDINKGNLESDADLLAFSLIGYRPRDYMASADLTDVTQVNVYRNLIKNKGTNNSLNVFKNTTLPQGKIDYDIYENWAIKAGDFGGVLNSNFVDFRLNEGLLTGNPSIVGLTDGYSTEGVQQEVPIYSLFNYGRPVTSPDILPLNEFNYSTLFPDAGYANFNDMRISAYYYSNLPTGVSSTGSVVPLSKLYVGQYVWLADYQATWQVMTPISIGQVVGAKNNLNGTVTLTFDQPQTLTKYQPFAIVNFNDALNGYYVVNTIIDPYHILINVTLDPSIITIVGQGIGFRFQSQRVATPSDIINLPLLNSEFVKNKVWVDTNTDGSWAVYRKSLNYLYDSELSKPLSTTFGSSVAYDDKLGYLISDADQGVVYRYLYNSLFERFELDQTLTGDTSFGANITHNQNIVVISQPTSLDPGISIYKLITTTLVNRLELLQPVIISPNPSVTNWGSSVALSGDTNWLFVSDTVNNMVYVYNKAHLTGTYQFSYTIDGSSLGLTSGDNFSYDLATDYYGTTLIVGAPDQNYDSIENWGYSYIYNRTVQNFEVGYTSIPYVPQTFNLSWTPEQENLQVSATSSITNQITVSSLANLNVFDPVVFSGTGPLLTTGNISTNTVYYIKDINYTTQSFSVSLTLGGPAVVLQTIIDPSGLMIANVQTSELTVNNNGSLLSSNNYAVIGSILYVYSTLNAGDILSVGGNNFVLSQILTTENTPRIGVQFGQSVDTNTYANEILVGAPYELNNQNQEGAVYRYTNAGAKYGSVIGTTECLLTGPATILINGYQVLLPGGSASSTATTINEAKITNVLAADVDGKLVITLRDTQLGLSNNKLVITVFDIDVWRQLGFNPYTQTQVINDPHGQSRTAFGDNIKFNQNGSFVVSAPTATRYESTTFDASDDENYDNDTLFDNNSTQWVDTYRNAGAVYMYDYLAEYEENLDNIGKFVYAQSVNDTNREYGSQPMYGHAIDFTNTKVVIGTPNFRPGYANGQVVVYNNDSGVSDWSVFRSSSPIVDTNRIQNIQLYSALTNDTLEHLDYIDPLQGKILGAVRQNIDVVSNSDPAAYNSPGSTKGAIVWGSAQVGQTWFDTSTTRFVNYHQNDIVYNSKWWGVPFPGSDVTIYSWIVSNSLPIEYVGTGTPKDIDSYSVEYVLNASQVLAPIYFYWVRNTNVIFTKTGKTLADSTIESYIKSPINSGISYFAPLEQNNFGLYNSSEYINANDTVLHIGFATGTNDDPSHSVYNLIRSNYADDFLPGLPNTNSLDIPESLYDRLLDSLAGVDEAGAVVPDPYLPKPVQYGILARPRQSFFINRYGALKNYLTYANEILAQYPISETRSSLFLFNEGATNPSTGNPLYNTKDYWNYINWWATGYDNNTKSAYQVQIYADLATLPATPGLIVTVLANGDGKTETYVYTNLGVWNRIGLASGTIQFNSTLWDYAEGNLGFGDNFYDTTPYDSYPSEETKNILRALNEEIYTNELLIYRNKSLILLFEYIQSETIESQNYLPWLNKTSLIDVSHTIRELLPLEVFRSDNQQFLSGYINEAKPYHVVIKDFVFKYTGIDSYNNNIMDFDLPATYNTELEQYITPELVYSNPNQDNQYLPTDPIWKTQPYTDWFNNYGLSIAGAENYNIATLMSYITLNSTSLVVDNPYGFPVNGIILIGEELIGYATVDTYNSTLTNLTRGVRGTTITVHIPGEEINIDLPPVILLDSGRAYENPPKVTAYIDTTIYPAPRREAILQAIMSLDSILSIDVIDPGEGYAVLPEIVIDSSISVSFTAGNVSLSRSSIVIATPYLQTGDLVKYTVGVDTTPIIGLVENEYYYVRVLETQPLFVISLHTTLNDAISGIDRVQFYSTGTGNNNILSVSAKASCVSSSVPVRENKIGIKFDRTSYTTNITDWQSLQFYAGEYLGIKQASVSTSLSSTNPNIDSILASDGGAVLSITDTLNEEILSWSSRTRNVVSTLAGLNIIRIDPSPGGVANAGYIGSTIGFYVNMPVKFEGAVGASNLVNYKTYYVKKIINTTSFTISETIDGSTFALGTTTITSAGLLMYPGKISSNMYIDLFYPGLLTASQTQGGTNNITVDFTFNPKTGTMLGGTQGFYTNLPIFFTGSVFGNINSNDKYYVTTVTSDSTFTMSTSPDPIIITVAQTTASTDIITCSSATQLAINDPIIFTNMVVSGSNVTTFGNIVSGVTYYVSSIVNNTQFKISTSINGTIFDLANQTGTCIGTNQIDTVQLTTATGSMVLNVGLPLSPAQITGQKFTIYPTVLPYNNLTGTTGNYLTRDITYASSVWNYLVVNTNNVSLTNSGGLTNMYVGMPLRVNRIYAGYNPSITYTIIELGTISATILSTSSTGNIIICNSTNKFYVGMPIVFTGTTFGNIIANLEYYVRSIPSSTSFTVSITPGGSTTVLTNSSGVMTATGTNYIKLNQTVNNTEVTTASITQYPTVTPIFDISWILGGYVADITNPGQGYAVNNTITIPGNLIGGTTIANDLVLTVLNISSTGQIQRVLCTGTPNQVATDYYLKVVSATRVQVYSDALLQNTVSIDDFPYDAGDYAMLPAPFTFDKSIIKYGGRLYQCLVSNNDSEFIFQKWQMLNSDSKLLNALDRAMGYYAPTINMPGLDLTQLYTGLTYPNSTYLGNSFAPADEYPLDTILKDTALSSSVAALIKETTDGFVLAENNNILDASLVVVDPVKYRVQGDAFTSGYGPEELVAGVVTDNLTIIVTTSPGTTWEATQYQHVGYNVISIELVPQSSVQTEYSFEGVVEIPSEITVAIIDGTTGLSTTIYQPTYSVDWITKTVILADPLPYGDSLRIDAYETGNGNQLIKSNTDTDPIYQNTRTGFTEVYLNCRYSATPTSGSGVIRPNTTSYETIATETSSTTNTIACEDAMNIVQNSQIYFQGVVFGGVSLNTPYYVKSVGYESNSFTISETLVNGIAGPIFNLTSDTGTMEVIIGVGNGLVYTDPIIFHNGTKLILGLSIRISETHSGTNSVTCSSTERMAVNDTIVFSNTMFGTDIVSQTTYKIASIISDTQFTIKTITDVPVVLSEAYGRSSAIVNDYAIVLAKNGVTANIVFATEYTSDDYLAYTVFGETTPTQYGYTIPETELFTATAGQTVFNLTNYVGDLNVSSSVVERNGIRIMVDIDYVINQYLNTLTLVTPATAGDTIAVTSYNLTERQYFDTINFTSLLTFGDLPASFFEIKKATREIIPYDDAGFDRGYYDQDLSWLTLNQGTTTGMNIGDAVTFIAPTIGGLSPNKKYFVVAILNDTEYVISATVNGAYLNLTNETGLMVGRIEPPTVANITDIHTNITPPNCTTNIVEVSSTGNILTLVGDDVSKNNTNFFIINQSIIFTGVPIGNVLTDGTVYWVKDIINDTQFTISETVVNGVAGPVFDPGNGVGAMTGNQGGFPTVRVYTGVPHYLATNNIVRIDGTKGSVKLNNNTYYVHVITDTQVDLYDIPYNNEIANTNMPVTDISEYTSGGYIWIDKIFTLVTNNVVRTIVTPSSSQLEVSAGETTELLVRDTPIVFTGAVFNGITTGVTYYIKEVVDSIRFTISATYQGPELALIPSEGKMGVTQWEQYDTNRLWVTINGKRVPTSSLRINLENNISILSVVLPDDIVMITSMMPSATPNEDIYLQNLNKNSEQYIFRANSRTRTWLTQPLYIDDLVIYVDDVSKITDKIVQNSIAPAPIDDIITVSIFADKRTLTGISVFNNNTGMIVDNTRYKLVLVDTAPVLEFDNLSGVSEFDNLTITLTEGNLLYVAGEQIIFTSADDVTNTVTGLRRGMNGTGSPDVTPVNSEVFGLLQNNLMPQAYYIDTWNSYVYNKELGDPLQISVTDPAKFLKRDLT